MFYLNRNIKCKFQVIIIIFLFICILTSIFNKYFYEKMDRGSEILYHIYKTSQRNDESETSLTHSRQREIQQTSAGYTECKIPNFNPFDASVLPFLQRVPDVSCGNPQASLTHLTSDGWLHLDLDAARAVGLEPGRFLCNYREVRREGEASVVYGSPQNLTHPVLVGSEFTLVRCSHLDGSLIYEMGHAFVRLVPPSLADTARTVARSGAPSVLMLGIDSTSRLNFMRQLPKSYVVLTEQLGATVFRGLNKVGDNTYPNLVTLLSGLNGNSYSRLEKMGADWSYKLRKKQYLDDLPAVWKTFSAAGYVTLFSEDYPSIAIFNYLMKGFREPPTDYYTRPFWIAMEAMNERYKDSELFSKTRCFRHLPKHEFFYNYTEQFVDKMEREEIAYFGLTFLTEYSHDSMNHVQVLDEYFSSFLTRLQRSGGLDNTVLIVFGDHGPRFGPFLLTDMGRAENSLPFFSVVLPPSLASLQPGMASNQDTLISWYDVYEMLADLATGNLDIESRQLRHGYRGLSPLRPIPRNRTCSEIGVPLEYCMCQLRDVRKEVEKDRVTGAAWALINHTNALVKQLGGEEACSRLELERVVNVKEVTRDPESEKPLLVVTLVAGPSKALIQGLIRELQHEYDVVGEMQRFDRYEGQSNCIKHKEAGKILEMFCYCKDLLM